MGLPYSHVTPSIWTQKEGTSTCSERIPHGNAQFVIPPSPLIIDLCLLIGNWERKAHYSAILTKDLNGLDMIKAYVIRQKWTIFATNFAKIRHSSEKELIDNRKWENEELWWKQQNEEKKQEDFFYQTKSVKKQKLNDPYLCTEDDWLHGHYSTTWLDLIITVVDCYNREASSISSTAPTLNHSHPRGKEETEQTL